VRAMALADLQQSMARLYTDASLRERFFAEPGAAAEALGLAPGEAAQLAGLSKVEVSFFADSLRRKRLKQAAVLLPRTHRALGQRFAELFERHAVSSLPSGVRKNQQDAIRFAASIESIAGEVAIARWIVDLVRYEAALLRAADSASKWTACRLRYMVQDTSNASEQSCAPKPLRWPMLALWVRPRRGTRAWQINLSLPSFWRPQGRARASDHS
jgi:hypothetical protein